MRWARDIATMSTAPSRTAAAAIRGSTTRPAAKTAARPATSSRARAAKSSEKPSGTAIGAIVKWTECGAPIERSKKSKTPASRKTSSWARVSSSVIPAAPIFSSYVSAIPSGNSDPTSARTARPISSASRQRFSTEPP